MAVLRLIRLPNLIILAHVQGIFYFRQVLPVLEEQHATPQFDTIHVLLFILVTVGIVAIGNIWNDILDIKTDAVNEKKRPLTEGLISLEAARTGVWIITGVSASIAAYLALYISQPQWFILFPLALGFLLMYNKSWKSKPLIGNVAIALLCALAFVVVVLLEKDALSAIAMTNSAALSDLKNTVWGFATLAFLLTWIREMIKDLEDIEGDRHVGQMTSPLRLGVRLSQRIVVVLVLITIALCIYSIFHLPILSVVITLSTLAAWLFWVVFRLRSSVSKEVYSRISIELKLMMLLCIVCLFFV